MRKLIPTLLLAGFAIVLRAGAATPVPEKIPCAVPDRQDFQQPDLAHFTGWMGSRIDANEQGRLVKIDTNRLLEGYRKRPGRQSWDGEHVGKWLHAATLAWVYTGDPALRKKLDETAAELCKCQLADGYLGTYLDKDRWTEWDVWAHKYNLIGLITYMRYTGNMAPLPVCRKIGDLLCDTFGDEPGKRDIIKAGHHVGLAPTSVLEPMVLLYRLTGEARYLDFCKYILGAWEHPNGPKIVSTLLTLKRVDKVGNGKAYEMLSCLNGALEYYRTVGGDRRILDACLNAWQDIVDKRLYLTGASSYGECFHDDFDLPNVANVGETCVTVTWLQFNAHLLRLTGEARFAEQLERVVLNQLFGAQRADGAAWGYYVQMEGKKPYSSTLDGHCCLSSGPRGVALIPTFALSTDADGVVVNLYDTGKASLTLRDQTAVKLTTTTLYPADEHIRITVEPAARKTFTVKVRVPLWCGKPSIQAAGKAVDVVPGADGYVAIAREWTPGDTIELAFKLEPRLVVGDHKNAGNVALLYGPLVLAADETLLGAGNLKINGVTVPGSELSVMGIAPEPAPEKIKTWPGAQVFKLHAVARRTGEPMEIRLVPFADAGGTGAPYRVWLPIRKPATSGSLLLDGKESRSRPGNLNGSIIDEDNQSIVVTFDNKPAAEDWYAVALAEPVTIGRVVFVHGKCFHDGGWFDASAGKPRVQVQSVRGGDWETVAELKDYPATTATNPAGLKDGDSFTCQFPKPARALAIRVIGKPACGDNPQQGFSSCAELQAFEPAR
ncbi:MAG: beta-L-arabinofuranosidase domain-containing protein [Tepidisphaeraceae bacterium]